MIKRFAQCLREYKWTALVSPVCMIGEVAMEVTIPLVMADLYDNGIAMSNMTVVWQKALQLLGGYESMPLLKDAVIFVHGNIGQENADYNLSSETLRGIYAGTAPLFWDEAQTQPLIPAYGYASDAQDPLWQLMSMQFGFTADAPDILTRGTWDNPVWATVETGRVGSPLFPLHYNWLFGEAGINGSVISVDGVRPTDATLADGSYPFTLSYYGLYSPSHPQAQQIDAIFQGVQAMQSAD